MRASANTNITPAHNTTQSTDPSRTTPHHIPDQVIHEALEVAAGGGGILYRFAIRAHKVGVCDEHVDVTTVWQAAPVRAADGDVDPRVLHTTHSMTERRCVKLPATRDTNTHTSGASAPLAARP